MKTDPIPAGRHKIIIDTTIAKPAAAADVLIKINGEEAATVQVPRTVPAAFTATESFDVGRDLGSPVSLSYEESRPFAFDGTIHNVQITQGAALDD